MAEGVQLVVVSDIFGRQIGDQMVEGLVDSESENEFKERYAIISQKWARLDTEESGPMHLFVAWFTRHKYSLLQKTMLKSICRKAGLGNPPTPFTTNTSESVNSLLKHGMDYKKSELPEFLDKLKSVIDDQEKEMEKAVLRRGKYELCEQLKNLEKKKKMTGLQR